MGPQLHGIEVARIPAKAARTAVESNFQLLAASDSALLGSVKHLTQSVEELLEEVDRMRQDCVRKVITSVSILMVCKCVLMQRLHNSRAIENH